ncbi:methyltransferase domain-containing protein [Bryocella elongata]|uniref:methyltransferase domain-containing protein n=1 Tax=Bryocella elongata TaxID=863522 RepID=UPI00389945B8
MRYTAWGTFDIERPSRAAEFRRGIGLFDVVEHIREDVAFVRNRHRLLIPGGSIYITVPAYQWLWSDEDSSSGHAQRYTLKMLRQSLEKAGFTIDYETYRFGFPASAESVSPRHPLPSRHDAERGLQGYSPLRSWIETSFGKPDSAWAYAAGITADRRQTNNSHGRKLPDDCTQTVAGVKLQT